MQRPLPRSRGVSFGFDTGVISGAILFIRGHFHLSPTQQQFVISAVLVGAIFGALVGGALTDRFGRRPVIIGAATLFIAGDVLAATAATIGWLVVGRIVSGTAVGIASFVAPLYTSEVAPVRIRGSLVSLNQLAVTVGIVVAYLVDGALAPSGQWRWMFAAAVVPALCLAVGMSALPESPRWLASKGLVDRAGSVLERLRGTPDVQDEVADVQRSLGEQAGGTRELFAPDLRPALVVGVGLAVFQQITGVNTVIYYAPSILHYAGFTSATQSIIATVGVGLVNVVMTIVAILLVDRVGRHPLLFVSLGGMILALVALGLAFAMPGAASSLAPLPLGGLMLFIASFAIGLGPIFWLLISEIYPLKVRGAAMSLATVANWGANLLVAGTFVSLVILLGPSHTFWLFALIGVGTWVFVWLLVPETKGRALEQIASSWRKSR